jgi:hypothetical protein
MSLKLTATAVVCYVCLWLYAIVYLKLLPSHSAHQSVGTVVIGALLLSYFLRPFLLYDHAEIFSYRDQFNIGIEDMDRSIRDNLEGTILLSFGFLTTVFLGEKLVRPVKIAPAQFLLSYKTPLMVVMLALILLYAFLLFGLGIGHKGEKVSSSLAFLARLIPRDLIFGVAFIYLVKYRKQLSFSFTALIVVSISLFSLTILATGSKSFVAILGFAFGTWLIFNKVKVPLLYFLLLAVSGFALISLSFVLASSVKVSYKLGLDSSTFFFLAWNMLLQTPITTFMEDITSRFIGFDGTIVVNKVYADWHTNFVDKLEEAFSLKEVIYKTLGGLVPNLKLSSTVASGVAVGRYIQKLPDELAYAGAVGIIGGFKIMNLALYKVLLFVSGVIIGLYSILCSRVRDADLSFILSFFMTYSVLFYIMSGNLDLILTLFMTKIVLLFFYIYASQLLNSMLSVLTGFSKQPDK